MANPPWLGPAEETCGSPCEAGQEREETAVDIGNRDTAAAGGKTVLFSPLLMKRTQVRPNSKKDEKLKSS